MKKSSIAIMCIIAVLVITFCFYFRYKKAPDSKPAISGNVIEETNVKQEDTITIYDIEEGYLTVPYNNDADKHCYNWNNLINDNGMFKYEDEKYTSKIGIDVSSHQKEINWKKVKEAGVDFVIIRLGYRGYGESGKIVLDSYFENNYQGAKSAGIDVGVYFFSQAINNEEVKEEAEFVFEHLKGKELSYPVVYDLEKIKNDTARTDNLTYEQITDMTLEFCNLVEEKGYVPSIYGNAKTLTTKMKLELFNKYNKWYAEYPEVGGYDAPLYPYEFDIWQYTEKGTIPGISTPVDIDIQFIEKDL